MKRSTERALVIGGVALGSVGLVAGVLLATRKSSTAAPPIKATGPSPGLPGGITIPQQPVQSAFSGINPAAKPPYTLLQGTMFALQPYETYLVSMSPVAGQTLAQFVASLQQNITVKVLQSFDVGSLPPVGWPSSDTGTTRWRLVISRGTAPKTSVLNTETAYPFPSSPGLRIWATNGLTS